MFSCRLFAVFIITALLINVAMSGPKKGKKKGKRGQAAAAGAAGVSAKQMTTLTEELKELKERLHKLEHEEEHGNHVHFFFHSNENEAAHVESDSVNVYVGIPHHHDDDSEHVHEAHCEMKGVNAKIMGHVHIVQERGKTAHFHVMFSYLGVEPGDYELHLHQNGDLSKGCESTGGHYMSPANVNGTIGHVNVESDGSVMKWLNDSMLSLEDKHAVIGRSIKIHEPENEDTLACCVIGWSGLMDTHSHHGHSMPSIVEDEDNMGGHVHHGHGNQGHGSHNHH